MPIVQSLLGFDQGNKITLSYHNRLIKFETNIEKYTARKTSKVELEFGM